VGAAILGNVTQTFTVGWLYPDLMNIYGDRGNILTLVKRAEWRGLEATVLELGRGATDQMDHVDVFFFGGGQDREQALIYDDLREFKQDSLQRAVGDGAQVLAVCGGYQLIGPKAACRAASSAPTCTGRSYRRIRTSRTT